MFISMLRLKLYWSYVTYHTNLVFFFFSFQGQVQNLDQIKSLNSIKYNRYNIIVLWDVNER